jgi:hypothetical protein
LKEDEKRLHWYLMKAAQLDNLLVIWIDHSPARSISLPPLHQYCARTLLQLSNDYIYAQSRFEGPAQSRLNVKVSRLLGKEDFQLTFAFTGEWVPYATSLLAAQTDWVVKNCCYSIRTETGVVCSMFLIILFKPRISKREVSELVGNPCRGQVKCPHRHLITQYPSRFCVFFAAVTSPTVGSHL